MLPSDSLEPAIERIVGDPGRVLLVYLIERRPLAEQERLAALLETESFGRLIAISTDDPAPAVLAGAFSADLYRRLIGLAVQLSPLRERPLAIPPLVQTFSRRLLRRLGWQIEVSYSPEAMAALQRYMWPGNLVELEAVVTRTLVTLGKETLASRPVEAGDLSFVVDFAAGVPPEAAPVPFVRSEPSQKESPESGGIELEPSSEPLDGAVTELAHQLRNPLTVIRSFAAQAAGGGQAGDEDSKRMANLAEQACERIEGYLKEMSDFASFKEPRTEVLDLGALLAEAIGRCPTFDRSRIRLEGLSGVRVVADREQARFVLANVLAVALAEAAQAGTVELRMETERTLLVSVSRIAGPISMIRRLGEARGPLPSWRFLLARRVAARNGWRIDGQIDGDTLYIRCLLVVEEAGSGGQKTNRFDR
ncbi:MAG: hybrid sensor histidine kinase/response regulator [Candidatus Dadabacteria bacterium]|nr:MAG: hybrid sensor histidine kinase/response regulator [Candidatus Dadabacteria bacterium]